MSTTLRFYNDGLVDLQALTTFGVSAKENENPIGFFGTGFKYAVAIVLRLGGELLVHRGDRVSHRFSAITRQIRGEYFQVVQLNGADLGFTTHLGASWEPWQAFRELYCNALDEGGGATTELIEPHENQTVIEVRRCPELIEAFHNRREIMIEQAPRWDLGDLQILDRPSDYLFYRGIRVGELPKRSAFTYNLIAPQTLTEDRTLRFSFSAFDAIATALRTQAGDERLLEQVLTARPGSFEYEHLGSMLDGPGACTELMLDVLERLLADPAQAVVPGARALLHRHRDAVARYETIELTGHERELLAEAIRQARSVGLPIDRYPVVVVDELPYGVLGRALEQQIVISRQCFVRGENCLLGTLIEEYIHLAHKFADESRALQDFLIDLVAQLIRRVHALSPAEEKAA